MNVVRALLALTIAIAIVCPFIIGILTGGSFYRFVIKPRWTLIWVEYHLHRLPKYFSTVVWWICYRRILGVNLKIHGELPRINGKVLCVLNHGFILQLVPQVYFLTKYYEDRFVTVIKDSMYDPQKKDWMWIIGFPFWVIWGGFPINRENRDEALTAIDQATSQIETPASITIFADAHRPKRTRLEEDQKKYRERFHGLIDHFTETLFPRIGGVWQLVQGLKTNTILVMGNGFDAKTPKDAIHLYRLIGRTFHIWPVLWKLEDETSQEQASSELIGHFVEINKKLREKRN